MGKPLSPERRKFLQSATVSTALSAVPLSIQKALAMQPARETGTINDVRHIVILMQENRSFDSYFGTLPGVRGFGDRLTMPMPDGRSVWQQYFDAGRSNGLSDAGRAAAVSRIVQPYVLDEALGNAQHTGCTPHGWVDAQAAWDNGRKCDWPTYKTPRSMGYNVRASLPYQFSLAEHFTVCDAYHCSSNGPTHPNRLFAMTGTIDPHGRAGGPAVRNIFDKLGPSSEGFTWTTYPEHLQAAGVSWKLYQNTPDYNEDNCLVGFRQYRRANERKGNGPDGSPYLPYMPSDDRDNPLYKGTGNTMPDGGLLGTFREDIASGVLPQVSFLVAPAAYSEYPDTGSPIQGSWYLDEIMKALTSDPEVWRRAVLIIHFDENDGLFDHAVQPAPPAIRADGTLSGKSTIDTDGEYVGGKVVGLGPRVPMTIVSPWTKGGWVNSEVFDHTSVLRFMEQRFGVTAPEITPWRRAICGDLTSCFDFSRPDHARLPVMPAPAKAQADARRHAQDALAPVPVPDEATQTAPHQPFAVRPSRALPYQPDTHASVSAGENQITLRFGNHGAQATVFHVYDRLHLDAIPRRYTVGAGASLSDVWDVTNDAHGTRVYDLWVQGPNGFHRHFCGNCLAITETGAEIQWLYAPEHREVAITLINDGQGVRRFSIRSNAYRADPVIERDVQPGAPQMVRWSVAHTANWYDFSVALSPENVTSQGSPRQDSCVFLRRCAGRMETGQGASTDPAPLST